MIMQHSYISSDSSQTSRSVDSLQKKTLEINEALEMLVRRKQLTLKYKILKQWFNLSNSRVPSPKILDPRRDMISKYARDYYTSVNSVHTLNSEFQTNSSEDLEVQRRKFQQMKQHSSLNRHFSDEKHPKMLSAQKID
jgi:hypothetical protein